MGKGTTLVASGAAALYIGAKRAAVPMARKGIVMMSHRWRMVVVLTFLPASCAEWTRAGESPQTAGMKKAVESRGDAYARQWNVNVQKGLGSNYMLEVAYAGSRGKQYLLKGDPKLVSAVDSAGMTPLHAAVDAETPGDHATTGGRRSRRRDRRGHGSRCGRGESTRRRHGLPQGK